MKKTLLFVAMLVSQVGGVSNAVEIDESGSKNALPFIYTGCRIYNGTVFSPEVITLNKCILIGADPILSVN